MNSLTAKEFTIHSSGDLEDIIPFCLSYAQLLKKSSLGLMKIQIATLKDISGVSSYINNLDLL
jgi:hypothetical protein